MVGDDFQIRKKIADLRQQPVVKRDFSYQQ